MVAHPGVHVQQLDLLDVDAVLFTEGAEEWCVGRRQRLTDALPLQILGCLDRRTAKNAYTHSRFVIDDRGRTQVHVLVRQQDQARGCRHAEIELPLRNRLSCRERAVAARYVYVIPAVPPVSCRLCHVGIGIGPLRQPRQREFHTLQPLRIGDAQEGGRGDRRAGEGLDRSPPADAAMV